MFQRGPISPRSANLHRMTLEQNRPSCDTLTGTIRSGMGCLGPIEAMILWAACPITLMMFQRGPVSLRSANLHRMTLEQNGPSFDTLTGTIRSGMCLGPREAMILWAVCPITLMMFQRGPIYPTSAKMHGMNLEQSGPSCDTLTGTIRSGMCLGPREAMILWLSLIHI